MTGEERARLLALKSQAAELLAARAKSLPACLEQTDARVAAYIRAVAQAPDRHCLYELLACLRMLRVAGRYAWDVAGVRRFFRFYERLRFNGTAGRTRYKLTPVQAFQFAAMLGPRDTDGARLTRTAYIFVPRKFSKTTSAASLAVWDLLFGDANAQAYVGANSYNQAKICFDEIRAIMRDIDPAGRHIRVNREKIFFTDGARDSSITCLSANARTQDGLNASLVIMDEYAQARNTAGRGGADLKNVLTSSMGARREPLTVVITTASEVVDGPFAHELAGVKQALEAEVLAMGAGDGDRVFASLFLPDPGDSEDDPATWRKVQPHLGVTVREGFYEQAWAEAQLSAENRLAFRTKLLNIFCVNERATWFTHEKARDLCQPFDMVRAMGGQLAACAFDLSVRDDFSAVSYMAYNPGTRVFYCHTDYYFPSGALDGHPNAALYREWAAAGWLRLCAGECVDVKQIAADIMARAKSLRIVRIAYDSYKAQELTNILGSVGCRAALQPFSQTYGSFNLPVESFEMLAWATPAPRVRLDPNPINAFCLANCLIDEDRLENKKPIKISQYRKIDGAITMLMALGALYKIER